MEINFDQRILEAPDYRLIQALDIIPGVGKSTIDTLINDGAKANTTAETVSEVDSKAFIKYINPLLTAVLRGSGWRRTDEYYSIIEEARQTGNEKLYRAVNVLRGNVDGSPNPKLNPWFETADAILEEYKDNNTMSL